jgi:hypothetical protein
MRWKRRKNMPTSAPAQPADTVEAEASAEALGYLQALIDSADGKVKTRDQLQRICEEQCMGHIAAYIAKYLERVQRYQDSPEALQRDRFWLASHGMIFCLAAVRHVFMKRKKEHAHGGR